MSDAESIAIDDAWEICADIYAQIVTKHTTNRVDQLEYEMVFCLLGGHGVTYELCASASNLVSELDPFGEKWIEANLLEELVLLLDSPSFDPPKKNGSLRRFRYPIRKAQLIIEARRWAQSNAPLLQAIQSINESKSRRSFLCQCPGIGPKTASWILRNIGLSNDLAVLDIHVIRALRDSGRIGSVSLPRDYEIAERAFLDWCNELDADPAVFDLFIWEWQRGLLSKE